MSSGLTSAGCDEAVAGTARTQSVRHPRAGISGLTKRICEARGVWASTMVVRHAGIGFVAGDLFLRLPPCGDVWLPLVVQDGFNGDGGTLAGNFDTLTIAGPAARPSCDRADGVAQVVLAQQNVGKFLVARADEFMRDDGLVGSDELESGDLFGDVAAATSTRSRRGALLGLKSTTAENASCARVSTAQRDRLQRLKGDLFGDLVHLVEARLHFIVNLVDGTAADGIVRMVFHQQTPCLADDGRDVADAVGCDLLGRRSGLFLPGIMFSAKTLNGSAHFSSRVWLCGCAA